MNKELIQELKKAMNYKEDKEICLHCRSFRHASNGIYFGGPNSEPKPDRCTRNAVAIPVSQGGRCKFFKSMMELLLENVTPLPKELLDEARKEQVEWSADQADPATDIQKAMEDAMHHKHVHAQQEGRAKPDCTDKKQTCTNGGEEENPPV